MKLYKWKKDNSLEEIFQRFKVIESLISFAMQSSKETLQHHIVTTDDNKVVFYCKPSGDMIVGGQYLVPISLNEFFLNHPKPI